MVEKGFVALNFRLTHSGPFSLHGLLDMVHRWADEHHYHTEIKRHYEHNKADGKEIGYSLEIWRHVNTRVVAVIRFTLQVKRLRDATITANGRKERVQHGDVFIDMDSLHEKHKLHQFENKPYIFFFRALVDRFIYKNLLEMHEGELSADIRNLYDRVRSFLQKEEVRRIA